MRDADTLAMLLGGKRQKVRKPRGKSIKPGAECTVWGHKGTVVGKHETRANWWNVEVPNPNGGAAQVVGFDRSQIQLV